MRNCKRDLSNPCTSYRLSLSLSVFRILHPRRRQLGVSCSHWVESDRFDADEDFVIRMDFRNRDRRELVLLSRSMHEEARLSRRESFNSAFRHLVCVCASVGLFRERRSEVFLSCSRCCEEMRTPMRAAARDCNGRLRLSREKRSNETKARKKLGWRDFAPSRRCLAFSSESLAEKRAHGTMVHVRDFDCASPYRRPS